MSSKRVLFVTDCAFPGSAMASRLLSFASLFKDLDYVVHILSSKTADASLKRDEVHTLDNCTYLIPAAKRSDLLQSFLGSGVLSDYVKRELEHQKYDLVFMTSLGSDFGSVLSVCHKHGVKVLLEQCEWFDHSSFVFGKCDPRFIRYSYNIRNRFEKCDGVIAISRLLEKHYLNKNVRVIRIPSILDVKNREYTVHPAHSRIRLVFTGNTSKSKELLLPVLESLKKYRDMFELHIYGSSRKNVLGNIGDNESLLNDLGDAVVIHGTISQSEVEKVLQDADYQIFIRPYRRSSDAGFPTKLCESLSSGTPVISNSTGDIGLYLRDGFNGYVAEGNDEKSVSEVFEKILKLSEREYLSLRENARKTALEGFDYRNYSEEVKGLVTSL